LGIDRRAFAEFLKIVDNDKGTGGKAALNHPLVAVLGAELYVVHMNRVVCGHGINLFLPLEFSDGDLRNENRIVQRFGFGFYAAELARTKDVAGIWKGGRDTNRSSL
jgi:hypothetical protein